MKTRIGLIRMLICLLLVLSCSEYSWLECPVGYAESENPDPIIIREPEPGDLLTKLGYEVLWLGNDAYGIVVCSENDFSTLVSFPMSQLWEDGTGLYLSMHTSAPGIIPYVIVSRNQGVSVDARDYLNTRFLPEMQEAYGANLLRHTEAECVTIGGKQLWMMEFEYALPEQDVTILMRRLCGTIGDSFVIFTAKKTLEDNDAIFTSLEEIITFYQNSADAYSDDRMFLDASAAPNVDSHTQTTGYSEYNIAPADKLDLNTVSISNDIFSMEIPENWVLTTHKQFSDFGVYLYDPEVPERKIYFYCKMEYFNKSQAEKDYYANLAALAGINSFATDMYGYLTSASVPVLAPATTARFYEIYPNFIQLLYQINGYAHVYPDLNNVRVLESYASNAPVTPTCLDNSILRISFMSNSGVRCQGLVGGEVSDKITYMSNGLDLGNYCVYDMMGITAPEAEFAELEPILLRCLTSFDLTSSYVQQTQQNTVHETDAILAAGRSMQITYESYNTAWNNRQISYDILSQKNSDAILGYDRLYDPDTNKIYRAEIGFYDQYDLHRSEYENQNLQILDSSTEHYYLQSVDYYISK